MSLHSSFIKHCSFQLLAKREGMGGVLQDLVGLEQSQYWTRDKLLAFQVDRIRDLLRHAYNNCSFYRARFDAAGFNPSRFRYLEDLKQLPPLTKRDLQHNLTDLVASNLQENEIHRDATGGSTGNHTPFFRDNKALAKKKAVEYRCNRWAGWDIGEKIAYYWPAIQDFAGQRTWKAVLKNQLFHRSLMLYSGKQNEEILEDHYRQLISFRPRLLRVFPNPLSVLAKYIKDTQKPFPHIPSIISVGEPLLESHRSLFKEVFGATVSNCYVSRECGNMACECGAMPGRLHINAEMVFIEPLDEAAADRGESVKFLVTDLVNYGMPFIRYQIEDMGIFLDEKCECGRGLPVFRMEAGRASDFLVSPFDKSSISGCSLLHHLIAEGPEVGQIQVIQDKLDHLILKVVKSEGFRQEKISHFDKVIGQIFKGCMKYDIEFVPSIDREKSNKYFFTKCLIKND